jgi:hypothetical protein
MTDAWDQALQGLLSGEEAPPQLNLLLSGIGTPTVMAVVLRAVGIGARVLPAGALAVAVLDDPTEPAGLAAAEVVSAALVSGDVTGNLLFLRRGPSQDPEARDIQAYSYFEGKRSETLSPPLVLTALPNIVEELLLDPASAHVIEGAIHSSQAQAPGRSKRWQRLREAIAKLPDIDEGGKPA